MICVICITGDTHGDITRFRSSKIQKLKKNDYVIICGDFGFVWDESKSELSNLKWLSKRKYTILFVEGAHENFNLLEKYPIVDFMGGKARKICDNVLQLMRGNIFEIDGQKIFAFGGGDDENFEISDNSNDFSYSIPSESLCNEARNILSLHSNQVDYIITYDTDFKMRSLLNMNSNCFTNLHSFLNEIATTVSFKKWYFGCFHIDKNISNSYSALYTRVCNIETSEEI